MVSSDIKETRDCIACAWKSEAIHQSIKQLGLPYHTCQSSSRLCRWWGWYSCSELPSGTRHLAWVLEAESQSLFVFLFCLVMVMVGIAWKVFMIFTVIFRSPVFTYLFFLIKMIITLYFTHVRFCINIVFILLLSPLVLVCVRENKNKKVGYLGSKTFLPILWQ